ncbi:unnamed protein product [Closterium sp. NIES-54]
MPPASTPAQLLAAAKLRPLVHPVAMLLGVTAFSGAFVAGNDAVSVSRRMHPVSLVACIQCLSSHASSVSRRMHPVSLVACIQCLSSHASSVSRRMHPVSLVPSADCTSSAARPCFTPLRIPLNISLERRIKNQLHAAAGLRLLPPFPPRRLSRHTLCPFSPFPPQQHPRSHVRPQGITREPVKSMLKPLQHQRALQRVLPCGCYFLSNTRASHAFNSLPLMGTGYHNKTLSQAAVFHNYTLLVTSSPLLPTEVTRTPHGRPLGDAGGHWGWNSFQVSASHPHSCLLFPALPRVARSLEHRPSNGQPLGAVADRSQALFRNSSDEGSPAVPKNLFPTPPPQPPTPPLSPPILFRVGRSTRSLSWAITGCLRQRPFTSSSEITPCSCPPPTHLPSPPPGPRVQHVPSHGRPLGASGDTGDDSAAPQLL